MYMKEKLTQCNCFCTAHALTAYTGKQVECISNSYPTFIDVLQPVTQWYFSLCLLVSMTASLIELMGSEFYQVCH